MANGNCVSVNPKWHPACSDKRIASFGGNPHVVCDNHLAVVTIADTRVGEYKDEITRGAAKVRALGSPEVA